MLGDACTASAVPLPAHVLGDLVALVEAHSRRIARATAVFLQWLPWQKERILVLHVTNVFQTIVCPFFLFLLLLLNF